jgi:hypothetical protein
MCISNPISGRPFMLVEYIWVIVQNRPTQITNSHENLSINLGDHSDQQHLWFHRVSWLTLYHFFFIHYNDVLKIKWMLTQSSTLRHTIHRINFLMNNLWTTPQKHLDHHLISHFLLFSTLKPTYGLRNNLLWTNISNITQCNISP